jgi:K+-transporting ATPase KdpF subunit
VGPKTDRTRQGATRWTWSPSPSCWGWPRSASPGSPSSSGPDREHDRDWENLLALVVAVALVGYLVYALVRPERF